MSGIPSGAPRGKTSIVPSVWMKRSSSSWSHAIWRKSSRAMPMSNEPFCRSMPKKSLVAFTRSVCPGGYGGIPRDPCHGASMPMTATSSDARWAAVSHVASLSLPRPCWKMAMGRGPEWVPSVNARKNCKLAVACSDGNPSAPTCHLPSGRAARKSGAGKLPWKRTRLSPLPAPIALTTRVSLSAGLGAARRFCATASSVSCTVSVVKTVARVMWDGSMPVAACTTGRAARTESP